VVGINVGCSVSLVGIDVVGNFEGAGVGISEGFEVGEILGMSEGAEEGLEVVGILVGLGVGVVDGILLGGVLGIEEG